MKVIKKFYAIILAFLVLFNFASSSSIALAADKATKNFTPSLNVNEVEYLKDGSIRYPVSNLDDLADYLGIDKYSIKSAEVTYFTNENNTFSNTYKPKAMPLGVTIGWYIDDVIGPLEAYGAISFATQTAFNRSSRVIDKTITISGSASNTSSYSVNRGIEIGGDVKATISSSVGFDVTSTVTLSDETTIKDMAPNSSVTVTAYPIYDSYNFDIMTDVLFGTDERIGFGNASEVVGMYTVVTD